MKANMKKWIAMCLVFTLSVACLSGCGNDSTEGGSGTASGSAAGTGESGNKKTLSDLGGMEIKIGDWYTSDEEQSTEYAKATQQYRKDIESKYNFTISRENAYSYTDMQETYVNGVMSNSPSCQVFVLYQEFVSQPLMKGLMYNLATLDTVDFSEDKWNPLVNNLMTFGDGQYGMSVEREPRGGIFYNKRMFEDAGIDPEEPYDLQSSGEWTWAKLEEYMKKLTTDSDGDGKTDTYAMASFSKYYLPMAAATNNATFVTKDKDGNYVNATNTDEFLDAMNWAVGLIKKGYIMPKPDGAAWDWYKAAFRDGEVAMQTAEVYEISAFQQMEDDWGFVMFPYNQENPDAGMKSIPNDNIFVIPSCYDADTAEKIAFAFDQYTEETPGYDFNESWKETYYNQFRDARAVDETLTIMRDDENQSLSYLPMISDLDYGDFCYAVYAQASTPKKKIEEIASKWDSKISDMNKKYAAFTEKNQ